MTITNLKRDKATILERKSYNIMGIFIIELWNEYITHNFFCKHHKYRVFLMLYFIKSLYFYFFF